MRCVQNLRVLHRLKTRVMQGQQNEHIIRVYSLLKLIQIIMFSRPIVFFTSIVL